METKFKDLNVYVNIAMGNCKTVKFFQVRN